MMMKHYLGHKLGTNITSSPKATKVGLKSYIFGWLSYSQLQVFPFNMIILKSSLSHFLIIFAIIEGRFNFLLLLLLLLLEY